MTKGQVNQLNRTEIDRKRPHKAKGMFPEVSYHINVKMDLEAGRLEGEEKITLTNTANRPVERLLLRYDRRAVEGQERLLLRTQDGGTLELFPTEGRPLDQERQFLVRLPGSVAPEQRLVLGARFTGQVSLPPKGLLFLTDAWHPRIEWDKQTVDSYEVFLTVPEDQMIVSTGSEEKEASTAGLPKGWKQYHFKAENVRDFGLLMSNQLQMVEAKLGDVLVRSYYFPDGEKWGKLLLGWAWDVINFDRGEFGFYPQKKLSIIPGGKGPTGGYPVAANIVAIHDLEKLGERAESYGRWIIAHEIGHQYWGEYVLDSQFPSWLSIGLGIYTDRQYAQARKLEHQAYRGFLERYLDGVKAGNNTTVIRPPEDVRDEDFDHNNIVVHGKGYAIISMLEQMVGKEAFRKIVNLCLQQFAHRDMDSDQFQRVCEEVTDEDLDWFFYQWLHTNRYLAYRIASQETPRRGEIYQVKVRVERLADAVMPIPVEASFQDGTKLRKWTDRGLRVEELTFEGQAPLEQVVLDPDGVYPLLDTVIYADALTVARAIKGKYTLDDYASVEKLEELFAKAQEADMIDTDAWFTLGLALYDGKRYEESCVAFNKVVSLLKENPAHIYVAWSYIWQGHNCDLLGKRDEAISFYQKARDTDNRDTMQHAQYDIMSDAVSWAEERLQKPFERIDSHP